MGMAPNLVIPIGISSTLGACSSDGPRICSCLISYSVADCVTISHYVLDNPKTGNSLLAQSEHLQQAVWTSIVESSELFLLIVKPP